LGNGELLFKDMENTFYLNNM